MVRKARIRLISSDPLKLDEVCGQIKEVAAKTGVHSKGPIPLPTRKLQVPTRKSPCGQGTNTWDKWEMRIHKRMIDVDADERTMRQIMHIRVPEDVHIEIELT